MLDEKTHPPKSRENYKAPMLKKRYKSRQKQRNIKSIEPNSSRNLSHRGKSSTPGRKMNEVEAYVTDTSIYNKKYNDFSIKNKKIIQDEEYSDDFKEASKEFERDFDEKRIEENREVSKVYELTLPANALSNKVIII